MAEKLQELLTILASVNKTLKEKLNNRVIISENYSVLEIFHAMGNNGNCDQLPKVHANNALLRLP